jgi:DNA-binding HxlR family transcriptional regulator
VHRNSRPVVPSHIEYSLTDLGRQLADRLVPLMDWIAANAGEIVAS